MMTCGFCNEIYQLSEEDLEEMLSTDGEALGEARDHV